MLRCAATLETRRVSHCMPVGVADRGEDCTAWPSKMSPLTTSPLRGAAIKNPLSTSTCKASDTVLRDRPKASASARLVGTLAPAGTRPMRMECTIISLTRPCSVALLPENSGNSFAQIPVISCFCLMQCSCQKYEFCAPSWRFPPSKGIPDKFLVAQRRALFTTIKT